MQKRNNEESPRETTIDPTEQTVIDAICGSDETFINEYIGARSRDSGDFPEDY